MEQFEILIASPPDREKLVAEIWYANILIAEINQETEKLEIEFYLNETTTFDLNEFLESLEIAKKNLMQK